MSRNRTGRGRSLRFYVGGFLAFLYLPVLLLPVFSLNASPVPAFPLTGITWNWYRDLASNEAMLAAARNSLAVAVSASLLSTALALCAARAMTRHRFAARRPMGSVIMAPLVLPEIIIAIGLLLVLMTLGFPLSLVSVTLGHALVCLPYSMMVLVAGFEGMGRDYEEASADLGETAWWTFLRITLPMIAPAVLSSLIVAFTTSLDEFMVAFFLSGTRPTLPIYIWGQLRFPARLPSVFALGTLMMLGSILLLVLADVLRRMSERRGVSSGEFLA